LNTQSIRSSTDTQTPLSTIVKLGGSLLDLPGLADRVSAAIEDVCYPILVTGGGAAAERVRAWHRAGWLNDVEAHWHAIAAMSHNASTLVESSDGLTLVESLEQAVLTLQHDGMPVLDVFAVLKKVEYDECEQSHLPSSWDVTSDSIAAWLSGRLNGAVRLLKSVDVGPTPTQHLDRYFPQAAVHLDQIEWFNLRADESVVEIVERCAWLPTAATSGPDVYRAKADDARTVKAASG